LGCLVLGFFLLFEGAWATCVLISGYMGAFV
jgi:hypothetical protein